MPGQEKRERDEMEDKKSNEVKINAQRLTAVLPEEPMEDSNLDHHDEGHHEENKETKDNHVEGRDDQHSAHHPQQEVVTADHSTADVAGTVDSHDAIAGE